MNRPARSASISLLSSKDSSDGSSREKNKMYRILRKNKETGYACTSCGYESDRRFNLSRHYRRIHCPLKKSRVCMCEKKFATKGEYFKHLNKYHPGFSQTKFIMNEKYKIGSENQVLKLNDSKRQKHSDLLDKENNLNNESVTTRISGNKSANDSIKMVKNRIDMFKNSMDMIKNLPLKKRIIFMEKKCLSDITNFNNSNLPSNTDSNNNLNDNILFTSKMNEMQRAFISQIDFDELNAILSLKNLKQNHRFF